MRKQPTGLNQGPLLEPEARAEGSGGGEAGKPVPEFLQILLCDRPEEPKLLLH